MKPALFPVSMKNVSNFYTFGEDVEGQRYEIVSVQWSGLFWVPGCLVY